MSATISSEKTSKTKADAELELKLRGVLEGDIHRGKFKLIFVSVNANVITLGGKTATYYGKQMAQEVLRNFEIGSHTIQNNVIVSP